MATNKKYIICKHTDDFVGYTANTEVTILKTHKDGYLTVTDGKHKWMVGEDEITESTPPINKLYYSIRVISAASQQEAEEKAENGEFEEAHPLCDAIVCEDMVIYCVARNQPQPWSHTTK
jgi:hypothetical protein